MNVRRIGAVALGVAAVVTMLFFGPTQSSSYYDGEIRSALTSATANEATAQGAPQQAVVNGWVARDLLEIIARQGAEGGGTGDPRVPMLLTLAVLGLALLAFTAGSQQHPVPAPPPDDPIPPHSPHPA